MADRVVLEKLNVTFAPAQKIAPMKRENRDSEKRRFQRQLKEEGETSQEDTVDIDASSRKREEKGDPQEQAPDSTREGGTGPGRKKRRPESAGPGTVVDIRV
ncbi:MAG: hypothetical protein K9M96_06725 [Deltaproteobacteria bacterium]|nr:hypothetical protein [Deltaproteobacteria bacterium]